MRILDEGIGEYVEKSNMQRMAESAESEIKFGWTFHVMWFLARMFPQRVRMRFLIIDKLRRDIKASRSARLTAVASNVFDLRTEHYCSLLAGYIVANRVGAPQKYMDWISTEFDAWNDRIKEIVTRVPESLMKEIFRR